MSEPEPGDVIFEILTIGDVQRVAAVHVASGVEVVVQAPANASLADVRALALRKLEHVMQKNDDDEGGPPQGGPGIVV